MSRESESMANASGKRADTAVKSADRALRILELLGSVGERMTLGQMAAELHVPKSSLHALLRTLEAREWVETDESGLRFALGVRALLAGASYLSTDDVVALANEILDDLGERISETVHLGRLDGDQMVYLAKRESSQSLRLVSAVGVRLPAHATALGKILLADRTDEEVEHLLRQPLVQLTNKTITSLSALKRELAAIRQRGYAIDDEESTVGLRCFAVSVRTETPSRYAMSCSVPTVRLDKRSTAMIVAELQRARETLEARHRLSRTGSLAPGRNPR